MSKDNRFQPGMVLSRNHKWHYYIIAPDSGKQYSSGYFATCVAAKQAMRAAVARANNALVAFSQQEDSDV